MLVSGFPETCIAIAEPYRRKGSVMAKPVPTVSLSWVWHPFLFDSASKYVCNRKRRWALPLSWGHKFLFESASGYFCNRGAHYGEFSLFDSVNFQIVLFLFSAFLECARDFVHCASFEAHPTTPAKCRHSPSCCRRGWSVQVRIATCYMLCSQHSFAA
jgi:hypothetical protein